MRPHSTARAGSFLGLFLPAALAVLAALLLPGPVGGADEKPPPRAEPSPKAPLGQVLEWTSPRGKPYWYRLPRRLDPKKPPALLIMLHGTGVQWGWAFWNYPIATGAFRGEDIVVAPEGMTAGGGDTFNFIQGKADGDHLAELIAFFRKKVPVGRVYLYGHSQGAFFAYWFAGEHPELVDGIVPHAGNVLSNVKHPALAREKVAVGILHGRSDAVVPVACAFASEKVCREAGYKKLKVVIVEGLSEQAGHWPLPKEAGELLAWLDAVSADDPRLALEGALLAIARDDPDLAAVLDGSGRAAALLKAYKGKDRDDLSERLEAIREWLEEAARAHAAAVSGGAEGESDRPYGSWAAHYQAASFALGPLAAWQKAAGALARRAARDEKLARRAISLLEQGGARAFGEALKALDQAFLAVEHEDLRARLERLSSNPGVKAEDREKLESLVTSRAAAREEGRQAAAALDRKLAKSFLEAHPAFREGLDEAAPGSEGR
jgi:predicted esterase